MWGIESTARLWIRPGVTSMRMGIRGLSSLVWGWAGHSPASGDIYLFFSRDRRQMKALRWDGDGFLLYQKRLAEGRFRLPLQNGRDGVICLDWDSFYFMMRGLTPVKVTVENRFRMAVR